MLILTSVATVSHCLYGENIHHCELRSHEAKNSQNIIYKDSELCPLYISVVAVHQSVIKQVVIEQ